MSFGPIPFLPGRSYVVLRSFVGGAAFQAGERLTFVRCQGHSRYDEAFAYEFRTEQGDEKVWLANEDLDAEGAAQFIALVDHVPPTPVQWSVAAFFITLAVVAGLMLLMRGFRFGLLALLVCCAIALVVQRLASRRARSTTGW